jgi:transcriptional regulator with XRE-family HTH domain
MNAQLTLQNLLRNKLSELQNQNPRFSLRAFARRIGMNPGGLSALLNGKRSVSIKIAQRISERLMLDPQERATLLAAFQKQALGEPLQNSAW